MSGFSVDGLERTVPPGLRASVTPAMVRRGLLESIARRSSATPADLNAARAQLAEIEKGA